MILSVVMRPSRWVPNSFVIACLLTLVTFALVIGVAGKNPIAAEGYWTKGFWELLELTMQLALIVLTGYIVAVSPIVSRLLEWLAGAAGSDRAAIALMGLVSMTAAWMHWGLGLIAGPIFLHFLIRKHPRLDIAAGVRLLNVKMNAGSQIARQTIRENVGARRCFRERRQTLQLRKHEDRA